MNIDETENKNVAHNEFEGKSIRISLLDYLADHCSDCGLPK